uniref:Uncharacterized protein n=1 Tax=viral metagenome TaxID=1070528 RepID=A0A6M3L307_9ZZZZ
MLNDDDFDCQLGFSEPQDLCDFEKGICSRICELIEDMENGREDEESFED